MTSNPPRRGADPGRPAAAGRHSGAVGMRSAPEATGVAARPAGSPLRVALLGFGTVGSAVARILAARQLPEVELVAVVNRSVGRKQASEAAGCVPATVRWTESPDDIFAMGCDVVIETIGGLDPVEGWLRQALERGISVVTANKQLIAYRGVALADLARAHGAQMFFNAAVAGGVPVIPAVLQGLQGDRIRRITGIVNGTCNFILSHMETGESFAGVLQRAQEAGYAEADPAADVDGYDARAKLCILARSALHVELDPDAIATQSIRAVDAVDFRYARELGCTIRQIARVERTAQGRPVLARVAPMLVPHSSPMAWSHGTQNMVVTTGEFGGDVVFSGHGAGGDPTAVAVVSDLLAIVHSSAAVSVVAERRSLSSNFIAPHYLRFVVDDKPGIVAAIAGALATVGANIDSLLQRPGYPKDRLPFVVTTEPCPVSVIEQATAAMRGFGCMLEPPLSLQMLTSEDKAED